MQVDVVEEVVGPLVAVPGVCTYAHVVEHGHASKELHVLEGPRDAAPDDATWTDVEEALAVEADIALIRRVEARDHVERGRLPGAVGADQADDLAGLRDERDAVERDDPTETLRDILDLEQRQSRDSLRRMDWLFTGTGAKLLCRTAARAQLARPLHGAAESAP